MARHLFGGSTSDYAMERVGNQLLVRPGATGTAWTAVTGGTQISDLTDLTGSPITTLTADADGAVAFYGPDGVTSLYIDFGYGHRYAMTAVDVGSVLDSKLDKAGGTVSGTLDVTGDVSVGGNLTVSGGGSLLTKTAADALYSPVGAMQKASNLADVSNMRMARENLKVGRSDLGIYAPSGWGQFWRAKRDAAAAGSGLARIVTLGGSATQGFYASNPRTKSWPGVLASSLQALYGDGGSGLQQTSLSSTILAAGDAAALAAWTTAGAIVTQTGTWTQGGSKYGPGANYIYSDVTGNTLTFKARGTTVRIYTVVGSGTRPAMLYSIDGAADVSVPQPSGTAAIQVTTVTGLSNTTHTVVLKVGTATTGQYLSVCGVSGENTSGVIVHNCALAGAKSDTYGNNATTALNAVWNGGVDFPGDLVIYTAGPNDAAANTTGDAWATNVTKWLKAVKDTGAALGDCDIMIALPHLGTHDVTNFKYQDYAIRGRALAEAFGCAFVDWWAIGRNSWQYWNSLGYWGTSAGTGASGTDGVHLSDAGFAAMAGVILPMLTS
ncbi:SGNH/GDSL hydrolase family protein [Streptomyces ardesiacus]|uniref:SGNH/GDSL hydrolase family protein n=1 Tax=Streptomyces ardesiacus TaxID=285564 RepID=UPI002FDBB906